MAEEAQKRLQDNFTSMMDRLYRDDIRNVQRKAFECMAKCVSDKRSTQEQAAICQENCGAPIQAVTQFMDRELNEYQSRIQRSIMICRDEANDILPQDIGPSSNNPNDPRMQKAVDKLDSCSKDAIERHIKMVPSIEDRIKKFVKSTDSGSRY